MPALLKVCLYRGKCHYKKEYVIGKYGSENKTPVVICMFDENCNQQRIVSLYHAKKLFLSSQFDIKNAKTNLKTLKK